MRRRDFIKAIAVSTTWSPVARAQQLASRVYRIAFLAPVPVSTFTAFFEELRQHGYEQGQNLTIDQRGFDARFEQFPTLATEVIKANPDAIICAGDAATHAAQTATTVIPIVAGTDDMVGSGLVRSLAHPGGNTTGVSLLAADLDGKRQEVLIDFFPTKHRMAALADSQITKPGRLQEIEDGARTRGVALSIYRVEHSEEILSAITAAKTDGATALNVLASPMLHANRHDIIVGTAASHLPAIYQWPETAIEGGLLGYGPRFSEFLRQWARQLVKVLAGTKPSELPVEQPTKFELVVNLKTAKAIGLEIAPALVARANEVIE
jgi:putative ABC transport system substrate-binding protein